MNEFATFLSSKVSDYVQLRRSLGHKFEAQAATLITFCRFVDQHRVEAPLTAETVLTYVLLYEVTPNVRARRHGVIRQFAEYLSIFDPRTQTLDPHTLPRSRVILPPRILDDGELARLLLAAQNLSPRRPLRGLTLFTLLGLLASTGLRSGEALRLDRDNVDLTRGVLQIRRTKFRKDRLVPVHPTTLEALRTYATARDVTFPQTESPAFFLSLRGGRLSPSGLSSTFHLVRTAAGLDGGTARQLRPHDLRHRFATTRIASWHREGVDVQARLPLLATYLGHVLYTDTAYYVTGTAELLGIAAEKAFGRGDVS